MMELDLTHNITQPCYYVVYNLGEEMQRKMYSEQTGRFPVTSYRGMQYTMVLYDLDSNAIMVEPMRNKTSGEMLAAYQTLVDRLNLSGFDPKMHILDNKISAGYKEAIKKNGMEYQLVPPNDHRRYAHEKAIQVFKDHFIAVLCGNDINFPMRLWCRLLPQPEHQLNLLCKSRVDPTESTFEVLCGPHD